MDAATVVREVRRRSGLSLRALADRSDTSHSTLAAYSRGRVIPTVATLDRITRAAGFTLATEVSVRVRESDGLTRGRELEQVLELAEAFPARHAPALTFPKFGAP